MRVRRLAQQHHHKQPQRQKDLLVTLSTLLRGSVYERLRWTFKLYDINGDGCIGRNELAKLIYAVHELMGRRQHQPDDDRKAREQVIITITTTTPTIEFPFLFAQDVLPFLENVFYLAGKLCSKK